MDIKIPYGNDRLELSLDGLSAELLQSSIQDLQSDQTDDKLVLEAMAHPLGSVTLREMAVGKHTATIIISDHTRPVPSRHIIPFMLAELRAGSPDIDITLLVATGFHRGTKKEELISKLGEKIVQEERIIVHDCQDDSANIEIGILPSGAKLVVDRCAIETDLLVSEGFIEPHFFAGFSGGRKSVLPGVCSRTTVLGNHCSKFIASPYARTGVLENNPIHKDMVAAARMAGLRYIVNVIINEHKEVVAAFAGDPIVAHEAGCTLLKDYCHVKPQRLGDIVISSNGGAPLDQNIYQSVKGLTAAESAAAPDAILIMCTRCNDGTGGDDFYHALRDCKSPAILLSEVSRVPMNETRPDQWEYQILARVLSKHRTIFVSDPKMQTTLEEMKLEYAETVQEALIRALESIEKDAHVVIIPDGISVIVEK